ncbi:aldehyde dehydrogenase family protein [Streptomyces sp. NPDC020731]|uniref:aldehyde dehydrogenase family protein n=1 Tax=Streptomyces sp. NPDC020731 TaxID=3365085 RepID=UPI0037AD7E1D
MDATMTIAGSAVTGTAPLPVENPATGEVFATAPDCSPDVLDRAVGAATHAFRGWAGRTEEDRRAHLIACGAALAARAEEVARLLTREQGKPLVQARAEVALAAEWFGHTAGLSLTPESLADDGRTRVALHRVPHGVVAAISPSNFPVILAVTKVAPALLAGNTVVLKPSPLTPLSTLLLGRILDDVLPAGVLNVVSGAGRLGAALAGHAGVRLVSFTGSVATGREIARRAAVDFRPVVLELGGNDASVVLPGSDPAEVARRVLAAAMVNSGQFCAAVKRVYVPLADHREFVESVSVQARALVVGDGADDDTDIGPLVSADQAARVAGFVTEARQAGARIVTGGHRLDRPGHFHAPTVVTDLPAGTRLEKEEQFGPVLPVIAYETVAEAVTRANATEFGLGGSVWGPQPLADEVAAALDCGTVWLNHHGDLRHDAPFGGTRSSGVGVEYGRWGLLEYTRIKVVNARMTPTAG